MTNTETPKPKKSIAKKIFVVVAIVFSLLGIDHYTYHWVSGGVDVTVTDSTLVVSPIADTTAADTTK